MYCLLSFCEHQLILVWVTFAYREPYSKKGILQNTDQHNKARHQNSKITPSSCRLNQTRNIYCSASKRIPSPEVLDNSDNLEFKRAGYHEVLDIDKINLYF